MKIGISQRKAWPNCHEYEPNYTAFHRKIPFLELDYTASGKRLPAIRTTQLIIKLQKRNI
ncbi:MAG: hypothetical protein LBU32_07850 [Clostridiales bacterium]|jgi:hypothetical protein|nr:hypothetical protein [Clostridiales bacterium]